MYIYVSNKKYIMYVAKTMLAFSWNSAYCARHAAFAQAMINRVKYYLIIASFIASAIATKLLLYGQRGGKALHICTFSSHIQCDGFFSLSKHMRREHIVSYNKQYNTNMHNMHSVFKNITFVHTACGDGKMNNVKIIISIALSCSR